MEFLDLRSGALAIFFLVMMLNLVLLGWSTTPVRSPVRRSPTSSQDDDSSKAA